MCENSLFTTYIGVFLSKCFNEIRCYVGAVDGRCFLIFYKKCQALVTSSEETFLKLEYLFRIELQVSVRHAHFIELIILYTGWKVVKVQNMMPQQNTPMFKSLWLFRVLIVFSLFNQQDTDLSLQF